jgi:hypothetical protein
VQHECLSSLPCQDAAAHVTNVDRLAAPGAVAHIMDEETRDWWRFDDETVTRMDKGPLGESADHGMPIAKSEKKVGSAHLRCLLACWLLETACSSGRLLPDGGRIPEHSAATRSFVALGSTQPLFPRLLLRQAGGDEGTIVSSNAYMLLYQRDGARRPAEAPRPNSNGSHSNGRQAAEGRLSGG